MKQIKGNAVSAYLNGEIDVLLHVVNMQGVMGSGIAKEIKERVPKAYENYLNEYREGLVLGDISSDGRGCVNLVAQDHYGRGKRHINYGALAESLYHAKELIWEVYHKSTTSRIKVGVPYKMGSDRAGGDWEIVKEMLQHFLEDYEVIIYEL